LLAHPVPIYLGCASLLVGSLGLAGKFAIGETPTKSHLAEKALFVQSAEVPASAGFRWPSVSENGGIAFNAQMLDLMAPRGASTQSEPLRTENAPAVVRDNAREEAPRLLARPREVPLRDDAGARSRHQRKENYQSAKQSPPKSRFQAGAEEEGESNTFGTQRANRAAPQEKGASPVAVDRSYRVEREALDTRAERVRRQPGTRVRVPPEVREPADFNPFFGFFGN
jgi:hypothetical protein